MNQEVATQVSRLLKEKISLEEDLQKLLADKEVFVLAVEDSHYNAKRLNFIYKGAQGLEFMKKIKFLTVLEVQKEIDKLEEEIKQLKYY
jgi:hypothetical protein